MLGEIYNLFSKMDKIAEEQQEVVQKLSKDLEFLSKNDGKYILMINDAELKIYSSGKEVWDLKNKVWGRPYMNAIYFGKITKNSIENYPVLCDEHLEEMAESRSCRIKLFDHCRV